jgi:Protein kinase domain
VTTVAGRFQLGALLGSGGVAEVWRARDLASGQEVALKQLLPQFAGDRSTAGRFLHEAEVVRRLDHPGIVQVREAGEVDGRPYLVMDLIDGDDLRRRLDRAGALPHEEARRIALAVAEALAHAHARGIVHRDVKPQNVLLGGEAVKLTDFGMARVESLAGMTGSSLVWGSPEYMAPELLGRGRVDPRTDLYSFGVLLFEMVAGRLPWKEGRALGRLFGTPAAAEPLPSLGQGEILDRLLGSLLSASPDDRPSSAAEVVAVLRGDAPAVELVTTIRCPECGRGRPEDIPRCPACGQEASLGPRAGRGKWRVVVADVREDADSMAALTRVMGELTGRSDLDLKFRTGRQELYSDDEKRGSIELPALFFANLDEGSAKQIAAALSGAGARAIATPHRMDHRVMRPRDKMAYGGATLIVSLLSLPMSFSHAGHASPGVPPIMFVVAPIMILGVPLMFFGSKLFGLLPRFRLRAPVLAGGPIASQLLADGSRAGAEIAAPEARALFAQANLALYRLVRRAEDLARPDAPPSSEGALARRLVEAAPALNARLESSARQLAALDAALDHDSEGYTARALAALARRAASADPDQRAALEDARRSLEAALERRRGTEAEREQLAAALCRALAGLRDIWRRAAASTTPSERELAAIEAALSELA